MVPKSAGKKRKRGLIFFLTAAAVALSVDGDWWAAG